MLDLIDGSLGICRDLFEAHPDQAGAPYMIAHDPSLTTLAAFQAGELFGLSMKLLNLPPPATFGLDVSVPDRLLSGRSGRTARRTRSELANRRRSARRLLATAQDTGSPKSQSISTLVLLKSGWAIH
jgi:hypothetical protein